MKLLCWQTMWGGMVVFWCFCKMLATEDESSTSAQVRPQFITRLGKNMLMKLWYLLYPFLVSPPNICIKYKYKSSVLVASVCFSIVCYGALPCFALDHNGRETLANIPWKISRYSYMLEDISLTTHSQITPIPKYKIANCDKWRRLSLPEINLLCKKQHFIRKDFV